MHVTGASLASVSVAAGDEVASFVPLAPEATELLSIIVPVYNEELYLRQVLDAVLTKELAIDKEVIIVESASTDCSRSIVESFEHHPDVHAIYQERARGKGNAVREALEHARGTIVLIQDADFEYDLDDYDALLEPIVQRRTSFVLGSRSLGLDDWKVRQYATSPVEGVPHELRAAGVRAHLQRALPAEGHRHEHHVQGVPARLPRRRATSRATASTSTSSWCARSSATATSPLEVPVNYVARSFEEGKKINFLFDAYPSYYQLFRCRFGPI